MMRITITRYLPMGLLATTAALLWMYALFPGNEEPSSSRNPKSSGVIHRSVETPVVTLPMGVKYKRPDKPAMVHDVWQVVKDAEINQEIYLYSAYYDDRKTIEHRTVRVIGIIEKSHRKVYCLLWLTSRSRKPKLVQAVRTKAGAWYSRHGKKFQGEIFSCGVPKNKPAPKFISILLDLAHQPTTHLHVDILDRTGDAMDVGVCVSKPCGDMSPLQVIEWIESLKMWGVAEVTMYNNSIPNKTMDIVYDYVQSKDVVLHPAPNVMDDAGEETEQLIEAVIINDCLYRNMYRYTALICTDLSELIVPRTATDYLEMLTDVQRMHPSKHPATAYMFRNAHFFLDLPPVNGPDYLMTQRYVYRVSVDEYGVSGQSISSPQSCVVLYKQMCWKLVPKFDTPGWLIDVKPDIALNQRWGYCKLDDLYNEPGLCDNLTMTIHKDESMLNFAESLIQRATAVLFRMNMEDSIFGESLEDAGGVSHGWGNSSMRQGEEEVPHGEKISSMMRKLGRNTAKILKMMGKEKQLGGENKGVQDLKQSLRETIMGDGMEDKPGGDAEVAVAALSTGSAGKSKAQGLKGMA